MSYPTLPAHGAGGPSKVPIPRLHKQRSETPRKALINRQNRVSRACLSCRSRKIKCNGLQPRCSNCSDSAIACVYASSRKDRLKTATSHNQDMITLLRDLRHQVSRGGQDRIDDLLASAIDDVADAAATVQQHPTDEHHDPMTENERGEANVSAEVGSSADLDLIDEDLMRTETTRATGFIGKASEIQWLRKLHGVDASNPSEGGPWGPPGEDDKAGEIRLAALRERQSARSTPLMQTSKASFYLDDEILEADLMVDPLEMPPFEIAEKLMQTYMESVHNSFPFLPKKAFLNRFYHYYASLQRGVPYSMDRQWQATLNLVFAIGAVYSHLTVATWRADERDHLIYHSRAWSLSLKDLWWFSHPDLPHMQITGLLSFYYLCIGHINRSWLLIGMAMRSGIALGMHMRNEDRNSGTVKKEIMSRMWWAHYALERLVSALTGRPSIATKDSCSIPLPLPLSTADIEDSIIESRFGDRGRFNIPERNASSPGLVVASSWPDRNKTGDPGPTNSGSYLNSIVHLGEITQEALALYGASTVSRSWESVQRTIANQNEALDAWVASLPEGLSFLQKSNVVGHQYRREQNNLEILYYSTKILITRPCLCRLDRRIKDQTAVSNDFNQRAALLCVGAAKSIADWLPEARANNLLELYQAGPWWQMVHVIMQALLILLLEVVYESMYFPEDRQEVIPSMKKLFRWLRIMRVNNGMAVRAYSVSLNLLKKLVTTIRIDITDLISEDEVLTPAAPSPSLSMPAQTHTPYPDILNPVHDTETGGPSPAPAIPARHSQSYHHEAHYPDNMQYQTSHLNASAESFHLPSGYIDPDSEMDFDAFNDLFLANSEFHDVMLPGWFITSFDEQNPLPGLGSHDEGAGQGRHGTY